MEEEEERAQTRSSSKASKVGGLRDYAATEREVGIRQFLALVLYIGTSYKELLFVDFHASDYTPMDDAWKKSKNP